MAVKFVIGEYRVLWEALKRHQVELERESAATEDEDAQLLVDDKLQKIDDMLRSIALAAKADWDIDLA
ncbi:hypothetical protein [Roseateles sp.]|jgi:hypothetical protein|uniref:hypothetical protein n=1 Tax=Roseateles sp. TaxID=1971397 RepID=UPI0031DA6EA9